MSTLTGRIVTAEFARGYAVDDCGLEGCECPDHEWAAEHPKPEGTYITIKLDGDPRIGIGLRVHITEDGAA